MSSSRQGRPSNFAQTCNLLSQYIRDKGSLRDLNFEINGRVETLETLVKKRSSNPELASATTINAPKDKEKTVDAVQDASHKHTSKDAATAADSTAGQLTIFYSGRVFVFDDFPATKAKEFLALARTYGISSKTSPPTPAAPSAPPLPQQQQRDSCIPTKGVGISSNTGQDKIIAADPQLRIPMQIEGNSSGLEIARRTSVLKFLEKRKDRTAARGPYNQVQEHQPSSSKGDKHLDLKL